MEVKGIDASGGGVESITAIHEYTKARQFCTKMMDHCEKMKQAFQLFDKGQNEMNESWQSEDAAAVAEMYYDLTDKLFPEFAKYVRELQEKVEEYVNRMIQAQETARSENIQVQNQISSDDTAQG